MGILHDWYITTGNAGRLCVLPERMMKNRESLRHIKCTGIVDAVEQLKNYERRCGIVPRQRVRVQNLQGRVKLGLSNFTRTNGAACTRRNECE